NGILKPIGGERPLIEETELFLLQAEREAVDWEPHPVWGEKVLVPKRVPGITDERLKQLNPLSYISMEEFRQLLKAQLEESKYNLTKLGLKLPPEIMNAMDFE
ncbi:MAG: phosphoenolpyruvate carboxykinase (ATP), partial [Fervidicoccaceae archaeon]